MSGESDQPSKILLDECFAAEDDRFLDALTRFNSCPFLVGFADRWVRDSRPWARRQLVEYLRLELNFPGHEALFKQLFKHFEGEQDHEMKGHFLVVLDRLVRRQRRVSNYYNYHSRQWSRHESLRAPSNKTVRDERNRKASFLHPFTRKRIEYPLPDRLNRSHHRLFSNRTRNYLRRRVWRYFRRLSYRKPAAYIAAVSEALCAYSDADFAAGENILDNWSLIHACYYHSPAVTFSAAHANLAAGHTLGELTPMPYQPQAWRTDKGSLALIRMIATAHSSLVRLWAMELLQRDHAQSISKIDVKTLIGMLSHLDPRVQEFAAELFREHSQLSSLRLETWLEMLDQANVSVLVILCDAMREHVTPERLDNGQMIALASARQVPVARMGFDMLKRRHGTRPFSADELVQLAAAECASLAGEIAAWTLSEIGTPSRYDMNCVIEFFDSLRPAMRTAAMDWLEREDSPGRQDPVLWTRLVETPFDDVRLRLIDNLETRLQRPVAGDLSQVWAAVILGVHRGGRTKPKAVRQLADAIARDPRQADRLLPVLAVAVRSVRGPERRSALSAVATLVAGDLSLRAKVAEHLPELQWREATV